MRQPAQPGRGLRRKRRRPPLQYKYEVSIFAATGTARKRSGKVMAEAAREANAKVNGQINVRI